MTEKRPLSRGIRRKRADGAWEWFQPTEHALNGVWEDGDMYIFRLSETYLLRAEAYLEKNNSGATAADINVVRARAQAPLAAASQVDIDYLPDERLRELMYEELRMCTLCRMGRLKFYHKDTKCFAKNVKKRYLCDMTNTPSSERDTMFFKCQYREADRHFRSCSHRVWEADRHCRFNPQRMCWRPIHYVGFILEDILLSLAIAARRI